MYFENTIFAQPRPNPHFWGGVGTVVWGVERFCGKRRKGGRSNGYWSNPPVLPMSQRTVDLKKKEEKVTKELDERASKLDENQKSG